MKRLTKDLNALLAAAFEALRERRAPSYRESVRVTKLAQGCPRLLAFDYGGSEPEGLDDAAGVLRREIGLRLEEFAYDLLEEAGLRIERRQEEVEFELGGVSVRGRMDGVLTAAPLKEMDVPAVVDIKTADGVLVRKYTSAPSRVPPSYRSQLRLYQYATGLHAPAWLLFLARSEPYGMAAVPVEYDEVEVARLEQVLVAGWENRTAPMCAPRIDFAAEDRPPCTFCPHRLRCWGTPNAVARA